MRRAILAAAASAGLASRVFAGTGPEAVLRWQTLADETMETFAKPAATKQLSDGTLVVVMGGYFQLSLARFPAGSQTPDVATIALPTGYDEFAFDPCGNLFVAASQSYYESADPYESNAWLMKYDSTSGRPLWNEPFVWGDATDNYDGAIPVSLSADAEGNALLTARTYDGEYLSFKLDGLDGDLQWTSPLIPSFSGEVVQSEIDEDGNLYFAVDSGSSIRVWAVDGGSGALIWGPLSLNPSPEDEWIEDLLVDPDGELVIVANAGNNTAVHVLRLLAASGSVDWGPKKLVNSAAWAATVGTGGIFVAGLRIPAPGQYRFFVASFDLASGDLLGGPADFENPVTFVSPSLAAAGNGDVLFSAAFYDASFNYRLGSARIGRDGAIVWGPEFREPVGLYEPIAVIDPEGTLVELYVSNDFGPPSIARRNGATGQTVQPPQDFSGRSYHAERFSGAVVLPDGNPVTAAHRSATPTVEAIIRKSDRATGQELWSQSFSSGAFPRLAADASGDLFASSGFDMRKLDGDTGSVLWGPVAAAQPQTRPQFAAFDASGNVIVASFLTVTPFTTFLEKRSGATGALMWGPVGFDSVGNHRTVGLALDASGNAYVCLYRTPAGSYPDWVTLKISGATGSVIWGPVFYDRGGDYDVPAALQVLPGGDLVVTGYTTSASFQANAAVIRYAGTDGSVVWGPILLQGPGGWETGAGDVVVNPAGDLFITGYTWAPVAPYDTDIFVTRLVGATGAPVWGSSPQDTGINDLPASIELLPSGDPVVLGYRERFYMPGETATLLYSWNAATGTLRWGPIRHEGLVDRYSRWLGVGGGTMFAVADVYLNGVRPSSTSPTTLLLAYVESLGIATIPSDFLATCGSPFSKALEASNVSGAASWTLIAGTLPDGVTLSSAGLLSGTPAQVGEFPITVQVQDSSLATAARNFTIVVREEEIVSIVATPVNACMWQLSVAGVWSSYFWEPGGQTTPTITVSPQHDTVYGVTVGDGTGCATCGSISIRATRLIEPGCDAPGLSSISPTSGPAADGTELTLSGSGFEAGSQARIAGLEVPTTFQNPSTILATAPALGPGTLSHVLVTNPDLASALLLKAFFADFLDVPQAHIFHDFVEVLLRAEVTAGCGGGFYCPDMLVTRAQMAVFLLVAKNGAGYTPPPATGMVFADVPLGSFAAAFIEALAAAQVTGGCGGGNYCPNDLLTREQMAIFLLRTLEGPNYAPPSCTVPTFTDVPCSSPFARWIEEIHDRGITAGCGGGLYCPLQAVSRGQMAVFLTETFGLQP